MVVILRMVVITMAVSFLMTGFIQVDNGGFKHGAFHQVKK